MSKGDKHDRGALIALGLILGAVIILAIIEAGMRYSPSEQPRRSNHAKVEQNVDGPIVSRADDFDFWRDSAAQWAMAVLSAMATGVSGLAIVLVHRTWKETKRTADAAYDGQRAWVSVAVGHVALSRAGTGMLRALASVRLANNGKTPALDIDLRVAFITKDQWARQPPIQIYDDYLAFTERRGATATALPNLLPSAEIKEGRVFEVQTDLGDSIGNLLGRSEIELLVCVTYRYSGGSGIRIGQTAFATSMRETNRPDHFDDLLGRFNWTTFAEVSPSHRMARTT